MNVGLLFELRVVATISGGHTYEYRRKGERYWICGDREMFLAWLHENDITL